MGYIDEIKTKLERIQQRTSFPAMRINPDGAIEEYEIKIIKITVDIVIGN